MIFCTASTLSSVDFGLYRREERKLICTSQARSPIYSTTRPARSRRKRFLPSTSLPPNKRIDSHNGKPARGEEPLFPAQTSRPTLRRGPKEETLDVVERVDDQRGQQRSSSLNHDGCHRHDLWEFVGKEEAGGSPCFRQRANRTNRTNRADRGLAGSKRDKDEDAWIGGWTELR